MMTEHIQSRHATRCQHINMHELRLSALFVGILIVGIQSVTSYSHVGEVEDQVGLVERLVLKGQDAAMTVLEQVRKAIMGRVEGIVDQLRHKEHDVLHSASLQFQRLGVDLDLNELGDNVEADFIGCAKDTQASYRELLSDLRRAVLLCWGLEEDEIKDIGEKLIQVILDGDRLPARIKYTMDNCLRSDPSRTPEQLGPTPFRRVRCGAHVVSKALNYAYSAPQEMLELSRRALRMLTNPRQEDAPTCTQECVHQAIGPARRVLRDMGQCMYQHLQDQIQTAWEEEPPNSILNQSL